MSAHTPSSSSLITPFHCLQAASFPSYLNFHSLTFKKLSKPIRFMFDPNALHFSFIRLYKYMLSIFHCLHVPLIVIPNGLASPILTPFPTAFYTNNSPLTNPLYLFPLDMPSLLFPLYTGLSHAPSPPYLPCWDLVRTFFTLSRIHISLKLISRARCRKASLARRRSTKVRLRWKTRRKMRRLAFV